MDNLVWFCSTFETVNQIFQLELLLVPVSQNQNPK